MIWASISALSIRLLGLLTILILGKLLLPADFGLIAIMELTINITTLFRDFGLAQALIQRQKEVEEVAYTTFFLVILWSVILYFLLFATAPWMAQIFEENRAVPLIRTVGLTLIISSLSMVPSALLEKRLAFKQRALPETISNILYALVTLVLVMQGWGVWGVVWGRIGQASLATILIWWVSQWWPKFYFNFALAKETLTYGQHILLASLLGVIILYIDNAFVGSLLGATALGFYAFGFNLANLPSQSITPVITKVAFPTYAEIQHNPTALVSVYLRSLKLTSTLTLPAAIGMALLSGPFLRITYGDKWLDSIVLIQILSFYSLFRSIGALAINILYVIGRQYLVPRILGLILIAIIILLWPATLELGMLGTSLVMTSVMVLGVIFWLTWTNFYLKIPFRNFGQALLPQTVAGLVMAAYLLLFLFWLEENLRSLVFLIISGGLVYFISLLMIDQRQLRKEFLDIVKALGEHSS
jgi:teichuronic acid exporter